MRRSRVLFILALLFAAGGMGCLLLDVRNLLSQGGGHGVETRLASALLMVATVVALCAQLFLRRDCGTLARQIRDMAGRDELAAQLEATSSDVELLTRAVNDLLDSTERSVHDALMKAKELEIQLKVATNERRHAEAIIFSISDAVVVSDAFDELVLANESAARVFNFELGAGRAPIAQVLKDPTLVELIRDVRASASRNGRRIVEHKVRTPQGTRVYKVTLSCVADRADSSGGVVTVLHDMTKEKEVAQMKNDFVSSVSHELRTPLASIKAYIEMLIDGEAEDRKTQQEFYEVIQNEANRLSRLIDNILNISRIESGLVQINKKPLSLPVVLKEALEVIAPQTRQKRIRLVEKVTPAFYQTLADKDMLYQAVLNLLSNAVKYTPEGGTITVETQVDEQQRKAITRISDTGVGIPEKDLTQIFDKFYRVEQNSRMAKGTGLGLSLVKHIIETAHKGRLSVESTLGKGTTFSFELDLCE